MEQDGKSSTTQVAVTPGGNGSPEFERHFELTPAFDKRNPDPNKNYGIHGCEMRFYLKGPKGTIQFIVYTNWQLEHVTAEIMSQGPRDDMYIKMRYMPAAADIGYHSQTPIYEGQTVTGDCQWIEGGECYYDGSTLRAQSIFDRVLVPKGSEGLWEYMEQYYAATFSGAEYPQLDRPAPPPLACWTESDLPPLVAEVIKANPESTKNCIEGKEAARGFLVGQCMRGSKGRANPETVADELTKQLGDIGDGTDK